MSPSSTTELPTIDTDLIESWRFLGEGSDAFMRDVIRVFQESSPPIIEELRRSGQALNAAALQRGAHKLKGSAANLGAVKLAASCAALEAAASGGASEKEICSHIDSIVPGSVSALERTLPLVKLSA
ncbi:Hpt domain-containing protein, partial [bacterium]|nr:Hpt domain-containing protein [bacterium]